MRLPKKRNLPIRLAGALVLGLLGVGTAAALAAPMTATSQSQIDLSAYKGKVVYLDFWASWCGPCKLSFPFMEQLGYSNRSRDLVVIAVNVDHDRAKAEAFLQQNPNSLNVVYDPRGKIASQYHVEDMPTSVLIGRDGRVRYVHKGFFPAQTASYQSHVRELLNEK